MTLEEMRKWIVFDWLTVPVRLPDVVAAHEQFAVVRLALGSTEIRDVRSAILSIIQIKSKKKIDIDSHAEILVIL